MPKALYSLSAGVWLLLCLFASTTIHAQEAHPAVELPHSIISLAPAPRPQGQQMARKIGEPTFDHTPANYHVFAAANAGEESNVEILRLNFGGETRLTRIQSRTKDFVVESGGTCNEGNVYSKGESCSLMVRFTPQGPGHRSGSLNISHSAEATPMFVGLAGNGYAPVISFTPSQITTVAGTVSGTTGTIKSSTNLAEDGGDILYIPDVGNNIIKQIDSSGTIVTLNPVFATPQSLVTDSSGVMYSANVSGSTYYFSIYYPWGTQSAYGTTYNPGSCTPSTPCSLTTVGLSQPGSLSIDPYDNLFFDERTGGAAEMPVASIAGGSGSLSLWYLKNQFTYTSGSPASLAVDASDNIYNFYNYSTSVCYIQEDPLYYAETTPQAKRVAGGTACGFSGDGGQARSAEISSKVGQMTFDTAGNLYFADAGNQRIRRIDAASGIISTIAGNGTAGYSGDNGAATSAAISSPTGLAVDSQGQVFILSNAPTAGPTQVIRKVGVLGYWSYGTQIKGTSSAVKVFTVANTGNTSLTLSSNASITGSNPSEFSIDASTTNCVLTAGATIASGHSCTVGIKFTPSATGTRSASLQLISNTLTGLNKISLTGTGALPAPTMTITSPASGATGKTGTAVTFAVSVTSTSSTKPTGTVQFKVNGANAGSPVTLSSTGTASTTITESTAATYTLSATYSGDANYAPVTVSKSLVVSAAVKAASTVKLAQAATTQSTCGAPTFTIRVSSASGGNPTGAVQLKNGTVVLASATLNNGAVTLSTGRVAVGSHTFSASYAGDSKHQPSTSAPLTVMTAPTLVRSCGSPLLPTAGVPHEF